MTRFLIGIDLGTTNIAVSYIDLEKLRTSGNPKKPKIEPFAIPQLVARGEMGTRQLLPSFLYLPGEHDLPPGSVALPWDPEIPYAVGEFGRNHGSRIPGRLVTSAKSWLCHDGVDRSAPLLPWTAPPEVTRISPVEASQRYLQHLVASWNYQMASGKESHRMEKQQIVLTVPASFDDVARNLTMDAAKKAGLENVVLLEEPQAAFYCWLATHSIQEAAQLQPGWFCLVVDVGGGTTDFSLILAGEHQGELTFLREAVGDHLLLGGDNMDLTLAKFVETKLPGAGKLDAVQYGMLTQACREAKESLLSPEPPESHKVTVMGRGRKVIGGTQTTELLPDEVRKVILEGFFPAVERNAHPEKGKKAGLHEMGLPYVSDPAITRHLAGFLDRATDDESQQIVPQAILFNGGVFQPEILRSRVVEQLSQWYDNPEKPWNPLVLSNPSLDLAVSMGAAHFAWLRHTGGKRIGGGIPRSYYLGVAADGASSKEPVAAKKTLLCVVPQHVEEGSEISLPKTELELAIGQPVMFPLFTSTVRSHDKPGDLLKVDPDQLLQLPPLHTILRGGKRSGAKQVPVTLEARCTEIGTVELWCVAMDGNNRWRLEFNVRDIVKDSPSLNDSAEESKNGSNLVDVWPEEKVQVAGEVIRKTYSEDSDAPKPKDLTKSLEQTLEASRNNWPMGLCRRIWEFLIEIDDARRSSQAHLNRWYNLVGFCLRPGFGDSLDKYRVEQLWKKLHSPGKQGKGKNSMRLPEGGADYWIMWRRVAGGLNGPLQMSLLNRLRPVLLAGKGKNVPKPPANELSEMWRAAASLERLDAKTKEALGDSLLRQFRRPPIPNHGFPCLMRLGSRVLIHGPLNAVVHPSVAQRWLDAILTFEPTHESEGTAWSFCLVQLARKSGQRALDVDDSYRKSVLAVLKSRSVPDRWIQMVEEVVEMGSEDQGKVLGDALPVGLKLVQSAEDED